MKHCVAKTKILGYHSAFISSIPWHPAGVKNNCIILHHKHLKSINLWIYTHICLALISTELILLWTTKCQRWTCMWQDGNALFVACRGTTLMLHVTQKLKVTSAGESVSTNQCLSPCPSYKYLYSNWCTCLSHCTDLKLEIHECLLLSLLDVV